MKVPGIYYFNPYFKKLLKVYNPLRERYEMVKIQPFIRRWILQTIKNTFTPAGMKYPLLMGDVKNNISGFNDFWWPYNNGFENLADSVYKRGVNTLIVKDNSFVLWGNKVIINVQKNVNIRFNVLVAFYNILMFLQEEKRNNKRFFDWLVAQRIVHYIKKDSKNLYIQGNSVCNVDVFSLSNYKKTIEELNKHFKFK